ncbi:carboxypeptidase-like regulatory domain-containing protein [Flavobacterium hauense]
MKTIAFSLTLLLFTLNLAAQTVTGKVVDEQQQPIEYVSIQLGPDYGVVSNAEGNFVIDLSKKGSAEKVVFSSIGYKTIAVAVADFKGGTYTMPIHINELAEVVVQKLSPTQILEEVIKNAPVNHSLGSTKQTFFWRTSHDSKMISSELKLVKSSLEKKSTLKELNKDIEAASKTGKDKRSQDYLEYYGYLYQQDKSSKLVLEKAVELKNREKDVSGAQKSKLYEVYRKHMEPNATYKVVSGWFTLVDSMKVDDASKEKREGVKTASLKGEVKSLSDKLNNFYTDKDLDFFTEFKRYTYTLEGYAPSEDATIYIIDFKPLKSAARYYGKIYVNAEDFAIVKLQYNLKDGEKEATPGIAKMLLGIKKVDDRIKVNASYVKNETGKYSVNFVKEQMNSYLYMNRPFKLEKNKVDKKEEDKMLKIDLLAEVDQFVTNELFIIGNESITGQQYSDVTEKEKYDINYISKYDPSIWKNYNILAPVEAIKNYN